MSDVPKTLSSRNLACTALRVAAPVAVRVFTARDGELEENGYVLESLAVFGLDRLDLAIALYREAGIGLDGLTSVCCTKRSAIDRIHWNRPILTVSPWLRWWLKSWIATCGRSVYRA